MSVAAHGYLRKVLAPGETVLMVGHQHWIVLWGRIAGWFLLALAILAGATAFYLSDRSDAPRLIAYGLLILPLAMIWRLHLEWAAHEYAMTDRRVIQISGVLNKQVVDSQIDMLNDVRTAQSFLGRMFDYGDIEILTASETGRNEISKIAHPLAFKRAMLQARDAMTHPRAAVAPEPPPIPPTS